MYIGTLEVFSLFDKDEDGVVKVSDIGPMLRSIGFNPSEVEIQQLQEEQDTENGIERHIQLSLAQLQKYMSTTWAIRIVMATTTNCSRVHRPIDCFVWGPSVSDLN